MFIENNKIKNFLKYSIKPNYFIKGIKNPQKIIKFFTKNLIIEPEDFILKLIGRDAKEISEYIREIKAEKEFHDYIWEKYTDFENSLGRKKREYGGGGITENEGIIFYVIVRILKPNVVLETGVANGISSSYILYALERNKSGQLFSIDLPYQINRVYPPDYIKLEGKAFIPENKETGWLIPEELKKRWRLEIGKSSEKLPLLLKNLPLLDIFIHDSEHTYENMILEFSTVWPFLKKGGLLLSHDAGWNKALSDFCKEIGTESIIYKESFGGIKK